MDQDERMRNYINSKAFQPTSLDLLLDSLILGIFLSRVGDLLDGAGTGLNLPLVWFELLIVASICEQKKQRSKHSFYDKFMYWLVLKLSSMCAYLESQGYSGLFFLPDLKLYGLMCP